MHKEQAIALGQGIRAAREAEGLSLRGLEAATGIPLSWLTYLEAGRSLEPLPDRVAKIAEVLRIDPAEIDAITGNYLARSLPTVRTYFRSKGKASEAEPDEIERVVAEIQARHRRGDGATDDMTGDLR